MELNTEQCNEYAKKIVSLAESAGCKVGVLCCFYNHNFTVSNLTDFSVLYAVLQVSARQAGA